ncbi:angiogenic factor with G patch and FHA domains 1-like isoform X3 [Branchiostoma floridae x Branchiostoma belcheri]
MEAADVQPAELEVRVKSLEEDLRDDLTAARKQLAKSQRQLETAEMYNEDLRKQVDMLNQELHRYKRRQVEDRACQTEDMLAPWAVEASQQLPNSEGNTETTINEVDTTGLSLADSLRATAEAALSQTGTVYDETSGMYYDYTTGMYYDPNNHLHYDPNTGVYYYYDAQSQSYQFHSQVELPAAHASDVREQGEEDGQKKEKKQKDKEKKKRKKRHKDDSEAAVQWMTDALASLALHSHQARACSYQTQIESSLQWPPCIRVMVDESDTLRPGSLFIITCDGGTIGREKDMGHAIRIPDVNISKSHVEVSYDRGAAQYTVTDLCSQNGTLLNGQRISEPKCRSAPCPVSHGAVLQLGGTVLSLHIHNGTDTCDGCEPGLVMAAIAEREKQQQEAAPVLSKEDKERQRRRELKQIKKKYQLETAAFVVSKDAGLPGGYQDRAGARRQTVGSDNPYQKDDAPASVHTAIGTTNKGRKMLEKMGWKEGKGLGKTSQGRQEPVQVSLRESQSGLGASAPRDVESVGLKTGKGKNWRKARERFYAMEQAGQPPGPSRTMNQRSSWIKGEIVGNVSEPNVDSEPTPQGDTAQQGALDKDVIKQRPLDKGVIKQQRPLDKDVTKQQRPLDKDVKIFDD